MAAALPPGVAPVAGFDMTTGARGMQWIVVRGSRAQLCRCSGAEFMAQLNSVVGAARPGVRNVRLTRATLGGLRTALERLGTFSRESLALVTEEGFNRESLRAAIWLVAVHGQPEEGTPGTRIWLPNGELRALALNSDAPPGEPGIWCGPAPTAAPTPAPAPAPRPTTGGGGSAPSTTTTTTTTTPPAPAPRAPEVTTAGVGGGLFALVAGSVVLAGYALATGQGKRGRKDNERRGASVMRARFGRR